MAMTNTQVKYARSRAEGIYNRHVAELKTKYTTPEVRLSSEDKLKALVNGKFKVDDNYSSYWYYNVKFDEEYYKEFDQIKYDSDKLELDTAYNKLTDELVLGDNEQALILLRAFEGL